MFKRINQSAKRVWTNFRAKLTQGNLNYEAVFKGNQDRYVDPLIVGHINDIKVPLYRERVAAPNHFHPEYWTWDDHNLQHRDATLIDMHSIVKEEFERAGRSIYNAGIGGELEVYERVDLMEVFIETRI